MSNFLKTLATITVATILLAGRCDKTTERQIGPNNTAPTSPASKPKREKPEILIDTILPKLGHVQVAYHPTTKQLWLKSWTNGDTVSGFTDRVYLDKSIPMPTEPIRVIAQVDGNRVTYSNIVPAKGGILFFAIADEQDWANLYAAQKIGASYVFLCGREEDCSLMDSTPDCKILDAKRCRVLWITGTSYDEERDWDIQPIEVYEYRPDGEHYIGDLKIHNWRDDQCKDTAILVWYKAYERIANKKKFDQYLAIPQKATEEED